MHRNLLLFALLISGLTSGCSSARYVLKEGERGVVAVPANTQTWPFRFREQAEQLMARHFPEGYVIDREEEVVVGEETQIHHNGSRTVRLADGTATEFDGGDATATTTPKTEWRIHYRRK